MDSWVKGEMDIWERGGSLGVSVTGEKEWKGGERGGANELIDLVYMLHPVGDWKGFLVFRIFMYLS
jgi:hypothetical protein